MKNEREEPSSLKIYINIIFGDITNSAVIQVLYALKDFLIKRLGSLLEHTT